MDITAAVYDFVSVSLHTQALVNIILISAITWLVFGIINLILSAIKLALELFDYIRARRKISRGYGARRLAAIAALDDGGEDDKKANQ